MRSPEVSFEFFPPQSVKGMFQLWETVQTLAPFAPGYVSVTYGAGGSTRDLTCEVAEALVARSGLRVAGHLTCVGASRHDTLDVARTYKAAGVTDIVALRGDPAEGDDRFRPHPDGFASSVELIEALARGGDFRISVGAYPDGHPDADGVDADVDYLKRKFDAGADVALTQFFFEADTFLRFRDRCAKAGIDQPIVPGILPIGDWSRVRRFAQSCGAAIPDWLGTAFETAERDGHTELLATALCTELCSELMEEGVDSFHFYTMNRAPLTRDVCQALGVSARTKLRHVA